MTEAKYTAREVVAIVEDLKGEFRFVAENVVGLRGGIDELKTRVSTLEIEMRSVKDIIRVEFPSFNRRLSALEKKAG